MRIGISTAAFYGRWETEDSALRIARMGVDCAEVFLQGASEYSAAFAALVRDNLRGVPCTSVHPLGTQFESSMLSRSPRQRRDAFDVYRRVLDAGRALGAGMYVYHGRFSPQLHALPWDLQKNVDVLGPMCEEARERGMVVAWENVFWCQLTCPERVLEASRALPDVRFTLDVKQAWRAGADPLEMARAMAGRLVNLHLTDRAEDGRLCLPGEGTFDFGRLAACLRELGYDGPVILEPYLELISSDEALDASLRRLRNWMNDSENRRND